MWPRTAVALVCGLGSVITCTVGKPTMFHVMYKQLQQESSRVVKKRNRIIIMHALNEAQCINMSNWLYYSAVTLLGASIKALVVCIARYGRGCVTIALRAWSTGLPGMLYGVLQDLKDFMRSAGEITYADAHKQRVGEG